LPKLTFDDAKGYLLRGQRIPFARQKDTFGKAKAYLSEVKNGSKRPKKGVDEPVEKSPERSESLFLADYQLLAKSPQNTRLSGL
jgi:hypothetical protein